MTALGRPRAGPETYGLCVDESVNERPFYVMNFVEGHILRDEATASAAFAESERHAIGLNWPNPRRLHAVDIEAVGLADSGATRLHRAPAPALDRPIPDMKVEGVDTVGSSKRLCRLGRDVPDSRAPPSSRRLPPGQHGPRRRRARGGDPRLEICTLGDPMADIGLLLVYCPTPATPAQR